MSAPTEAEVRTSVVTAQTHLERAAEQVVWQIENEVWTVLGYPDWDAMREAEYGGAAVIVPRADRPELVAKLQSQGLSQRQTADTIGVSLGTVNNDAFKNEHGHAKPPRPQTPGVETRPREDRSAPGPTDSDAPSPAPDADPIGDAKAAAKTAPARIGSAVMLDLEKAHGHIVRAGGPAAICDDNEDLGAAFNPPLWADTLDRLIPLLTEWRRQLRRTHLRGVK